MAAAERIAARPRVLFIAFAVYLILTLVWRVVTPAHELPVRSDQLTTMLLDGLMLAGLVGLRVRVRQAGNADPSSAMMRALFGLGVAAGIGLFAVRLTSGNAWWSGHLRYTF